MKKQIVSLLAGIGLGAMTAATMVAPAFANDAATVRPIKAEQPGGRMESWREARFGMFIHWGLYAIPARGEWVQWSEQIPVREYAKLADQFDAKAFNADEWAEVAKVAGMKYMVLTARHHDGFALFDDGDNPFTSVTTAARRDFVADYVKAVRKAGLGVGLYYSPMDWRFPGYFMPDLHIESAEAMREQYHRQMKNLLTKYGKLDVLWFDGGETFWLNFGADWQIGNWVKRPWGQPYKGRFSWQHDKVHALLRSAQPQVVINGRADMPEDFHTREGEGALGNFDNQRPWELCTTLAGAWGYQAGREPNALDHMIRLLVNTVGRDGNLLLNVGPRPDGSIDPAQVARLREIGAWLGKYGQSIHGTRGGPFLPAAYGVSTHRDKTVYVHVLKWPGERLVLPALPAKVLRASTLDGAKVGLVQSASGIELSVAPGDRREIDTIIALELDKPAGPMQPVAVADKPAL